MKLEEVIKMEKLLKTIGVLAIAIVIFLSGYSVGRTPTSEEIVKKQQEESVVEEITKLATLYREIYDTCELKYQLGIKGDFTSAFELRGRQQKLLEEIDKILIKYRTEEF